MAMQEYTDMPALLLVNLGTPAAPTAAAVSAYLDEFLSDPRVVQLPRWLWKPLLRKLILPRRSPVVAKKYAEVWLPGGSPLAVHTAALADAVRAKLPGWRVAHAMRYGAPSLAAALQALRNEGVREVRVLPLYPQYSTTTTEPVADVIAAHAGGMQVSMLRDYHRDGGWAAAVAASIRAHWAVHGRGERLLFSFHGLPQRVVDAGDPYARQCEASAQAIAAALGMDLHFLPCFEITGEKYGNAVLSRLPMHSVRAHSLPARNGRCEPRGAVWVQIDCHAVRLNLVATHLSFDPHERRLQVDALLGPQWLEDPRCSAPVVVCGDFNAGPRSDLYRRITRRLRDAQLAGPSAVPQRTWFSPWPLARIDHVFLSPDLGVKSAGVAKSSLSRVASDHLPVAVEILLPVTAAPPHDGDTADQNRHAVP